MINYKKFRIESYIVKSGRCWGCVQENCGYGQCNCYCHSATETEYRIMRGDIVVKSGFNSPPDIKLYVDKNLNIPKIRKTYSDRRKDIMKKLSKLDKEEKKHIEEIKRLRGF